MFTRMSRKIKIRIALALGVLALVWYSISLPNPLFADPCSTVLEDRHGELLSATIAGDGQWRFPQRDSIPEKFAQALIAFEDKRFRSHPGVDLLSLGRALRQNIKAGRIVSGGSTISMQVLRLARKGKSRSILEKTLEIILATRLEIRYSKDEILSYYASHAPFGGNVVGIDAACWRYFGRGPEALSWGEAAMLAVLPNSPSLIHLSKNREKLRLKRNRLLDMLQALGALDATACSLAKEEPIPPAPLPLPRYARHLLARAIRDGHKGERVRSTLTLTMQERIEQIAEDHHRVLAGNHIHNLAALVLDVKTGEALAYVGNSTPQTADSHGHDVDIITSPRSTGSILKPFLYAAALDEGKILPRTLLPDVPTLISGFAPRNFTKEYDGAVPADQALIRSLNVPAVHLLRQYRYEKFHALLQDLGMTTLVHPPDHYGLSLILGGAEGTLWDISGMYASMARTLNNYFEHPGKNKYDLHDVHPPAYLITPVRREAPDLQGNTVVSASAIYAAFHALKELYRPGEETGWRHFSSSRKIAWKTGTSFGLRDGWAVGVTPDYVVGVWVGNADGEGRPGLTGTEVASPVMFDIFSQLPGQGWFERPGYEMDTISVCIRSGRRSTALCDERVTEWVPQSGLQSLPCSYHQRIHLSADKKYRVNADCEPVGKMITAHWFVLPPVQEFYFRSRNLSYHPLPPYRRDCSNASAVSAMDLIYPKARSKIFVPRELDGTPSTVIFELAHRDPSTHVFWHIDGTFVGSTRKHHRLSLQPSYGKHLLTVVDDSGEFLEREFDIISGQK
jgi:penicillin-binding protein 1C